MKNPPALDVDLFPPFIGFPDEGLTFLRRLKKNNTREWFAGHKHEYEEYVKFPMQCLIASLQQPLSAIVPEIDVNSKRSMFRIYRDTRFSNDKTPYKTHVAAVFHLKGHWEDSAGFYVHIEPGSIYVGGGIYMPSGDQLKLIRRAIADRSEEFKSIVTGPTFKKTFKSLEGEKLQRAPLGYPVDHPMIEWLKHKSFYTGVEWNDEVCGKKDFVTKIVNVYKQLLPLIRFLNSALGK